MAQNITFPFMVVCGVTERAHAIFWLIDYRSHRIFCAYRYQYSLLMNPLNSKESIFVLF